MTNVSTNYFINNFIGSRPAIRLVQLGCDWAGEALGDQPLEIFNLAVDLPALGHYLKDLDRVIYLPKVITNINKVRKAYLDLSQDNSAYRVTTVAISVLKLIADGAAALKYLAFFGVVVLVPGVKGLGGAKSALGVPANLMVLSQKIYDNYRIYNSVGGENSQQWNQNCCVIAGAIFSLSLDFFSTLDFLFGSEMKETDRMTGAIFRFWKTGAALSKAIENYIRL